MPLTTNGFYYCVKGRHFIAIRQQPPAVKKLLVMFHEFAHFLMHSPDTNTTASFHGLGKKTRKEREADTFTLSTLVPKSVDRRREMSELSRWLYDRSCFTSVGDYAARTLIVSVARPVCIPDSSLRLSDLLDTLSAWKSIF